MNASVNEREGFVNFCILLKNFKIFNNFKVSTKVEINEATEARLPWIESHNFWLLIRCGPSSVTALFSTLVAVLKFHDYLKNVTKSFRKITNLVVF